MLQNSEKRGFISIPLLIGIIFAVVSASGVGVGVNEYNKASKTIEEAKSLTAEEKYSEAIDKLETTRKGWLVGILGVKKQEIESRIEKTKELFQDREEYMQALEKTGQEQWEEAKELFSRISQDSPYYGEASGKIGKIKSMAIEQQIKEALAEASQEVESSKEKLKAEAEKAKAELEALKNNLDDSQKEPSEEITKSEDENFSIDEVIPNEILNNIVSILTIKGKGFKDESSVLVGSSSVEVIDIIDEETITVKVEPGLETGKYDLKIINQKNKTAVLRNSLNVIGVPAGISIPIKELTTTEIVDKVSPSIVQIKNDRCGGTGYCTGSGIIIEDSGYILTNEHLIRNDSLIEVRLDDGRMINGSVIGWNQPMDLALIKVPLGGLLKATLGNSDRAFLAQKIVALGYPAIGFPGSITVLEGILSNNQLVEDAYGVSVDYFRTSFNIQPGSSGGALVNSAGEVIGINNYCVGFFDVCVEGYGHTIKINTAKKIMTDLKNGIKTVFTLPENPPSEKTSDNTPPVMIVVHAFDIKENSATITWGTDEPSSSQVQYGASPDYLPYYSDFDSRLITGHNINLSNLISGKSYYYIAMSKDKYHNQATSSGMFTTLAEESEKPLFSLECYNSCSGRTRSSNDKIVRLNVIGSELTSEALIRSITINVSGDFNKISATTTPFYLKTTNGTTKATAYYNKISNYGTINFDLDEEIPVGTGITTYNIITNTINLLTMDVSGVSEALNLGINSGASNVAGGVIWREYPGGEEINWFDIPYPIYISLTY